MTVANDGVYDVLRLNRMLQEVAASTRTRFVDLCPVFLDAGGRLDVRYTTDGLHLHEAGYELRVDHLRTEGCL